MMKGKGSLTVTVQKDVGPPARKSNKNSGQQQVAVHEGVVLSEKERQYLLPHFMMIIVGKPGSGKTSTIKQLLNDRNFYFQKFDDVLILSPSATKMEIKVKKENMSQIFDIAWIEEKLLAINRR